MSAVLNLLMPLPKEVVKYHHLLLDSESIFRIIQGREEDYLEIHLKQGCNGILDVDPGLSAIKTHLGDNYRNNLITEEDFLIIRDFIKSELMPALEWAFPQIYIEEEIPNIQSR